MTTATLAFIGGGNMASSLIGGLIQDGYDPAHLIVSEPDGEKRRFLAERYGICALAENEEAQRRAEVVLLCIKPQVAKSVCRALGQASPKPAPLTISIMAGIRERDLQHWLDDARPLVRAMPNTPAMIQAGAIVLHASPEVTPDQRNLAETILRAGGLTRWVPEEGLLDVATAVSGSGPAYFFLLMEALEKAAVALGLDEENARLLSIQTALGAARMAVESEGSPETLRAQVTSPGGTTEQALEVFQAGGFEPLVLQAVQAAHRRSQELSQLLGEDA